MTKVRKRRGLGFGLILTAGAAVALATPALASAASTSIAAPAHHAMPTAHISGVIPAEPIASEQAGPATPPPFMGTPPLLFHGSPPTCFFSPCENGNVMMTQETGPLVITPIFWDPPGHSFAPGYKGIITQYLADVAAASGQNTNVYSVANEFFGNNGQIHYNIQLGTPINDRSPLPADGCTVAPADTTAIYADNTGYNACLDDAQLQAEIDSVTAARGLPHNFTHIYVLYTAKAVESCFNPGSTTSTAGGQACTINHQPTAAYCAYHNESASSAVYANMSYPIYHSPVHFTCGSDARVAGFGTIETPNNNPDADVEISPTSHEINESITDPDTETGWYDSHGFENGDECAYIYGTSSGSAGQFYNQTINGQHYLTQEEFSNNVFNAAAANGIKAGCVQSQGAEF
jgi:hypothetical protein